MRVLIIVAMCLAAFTTHAQFHRVYLAPGLGLDFGGLGLNTTLMVTPRVGLFAGLGYNFKSIGTNGGARVYFNGPGKKFRPYISAMYGYNAVVIIKSMSNVSRTFYGPSVGFGGDIATGPNAWTFAVYIPFRSPDVDAYINTLKSSGYKFERELLPFTISVGYRIAIGD